MLPQAGHVVTGLDLLPSDHTQLVGSILDRRFVRASLEGVEAVVHTATLHKPHIGTHDRGAFVAANITGTLNLLEEAVGAGAGVFVYTSTTSTFGGALNPPEGSPAAWVTEEVAPVPKNIYGVTKLAAESLCELVHRDTGLACLVLRTSRFFPEGDDNDEARNAFDDLNLKVNELLYRRVDIQDVVDAHLLALQRAPAIGFGRYIISATSPFGPDDLALLNVDAPRVVGRHFPHYTEIYRGRGWSMLPAIDRVYVNARARHDLGWEPKFDFAYALDCLDREQDPRSPLALSIGAKGYHAKAVGVYTVR